MENITFLECTKFVVQVEVLINNNYISGVLETALNHRKWAITGTRDKRLSSGVVN